MDLKRVTIEISTLCNSACITCPHSEIKRDKNIDEKRAFEIITKDCLEYKDTIDFFEFHNYNEPLLTFDLYCRLSMLVNAIYGYGKTGLVTNGSIMSKHIADCLFKLAPAHIYFSCDGYSKEVFESHRKTLDRDKIFQNIEYFVKFCENIESWFGDKIYPYVSMVVTDKNRHEKEMLINHFKGKHCHVSFQDCDGRGEVVGKEKNINDISEIKACDWALGQIYILSNLDVVPCCLDWNGTEVMGNLRNQTVKEVWEGEKYQEFRYKQLNGKKKEINLCSKCKSNLIAGYPRHKS